MQNTRVRTASISEVFILEHHNTQSLALGSSYAYNPHHVSQMLLSSLFKAAGGAGAQITCAPGPYFISFSDLVRAGSSPRGCLRRLNADRRAYFHNHPCSSAPTDRDGEEAVDKGRLRSGINAYGQLDPCVLTRQVVIDEHR
jgi:hypothetical protein